ncbi:hypothetical protein IscW_ISCW016236 [Ixodes scapularis]|uniref:Uncharacterized protein n=1 Tax=Ixodes scapularis TaxID=6945 RepID=B7P0Q4_IXOSC|nr:hypothetical protein IscW_ISCW016236 [Ixodes scapularis]|eukprot:XP_002399333.1 hypothetical protein IscW_ISCW016236 [Ixodes scapularis]
MAPACSLIVRGRKNSVLSKHERLTRWNQYKEGGFKGEGRACTGCRTRFAQYKDGMEIRRSRSNWSHGWLCGNNSPASEMATCGAALHVEWQSSSSMSGSRCITGRETAPTAAPLPLKTRTIFSGPLEIATEIYIMLLIILGL